MTYQYTGFSKDSTSFSSLPKNWQRISISSVILNALVFIYILYYGSLSTSANGLSAQTLALPNDGLDAVLGLTSPWEDGFTMMVPTFRRPERIAPLVALYATGEIPSLRLIVIMWHDAETPPTPDLLANVTGHPIEVTVEMRGASLNERFRRSDNVRTAAVLSIDDDLLFKPEDIELGYQAWKGYGGGRRRMVGYMQRQITPSHEYRWNIAGFHDYSIVLTKAAFLHVQWLDAYWSDSPKSLAEARGYVEQHRNCEDILMSFLQARLTRTAPLYVHLPYQDVGEGSGISAGTTHADQRTACVQKFMELFGEDTLVSTDMFVGRIS